MIRLVAGALASLLVLLGAAALVTDGAQSIQREQAQTSPTPPTLVASPPAVVPAAPSSCHARGSGTQVEPDPLCTPGVVAITDSSVICAPGYSTRGVRPPVSYTNALKAQQIRAYGYQDTSPRSYEEDHLISLELGGSPTDPRNLWPEPGASPNHKDRLENTLHRLVCSGQVPLATAQQAISTDWVSAYVKYVGGTP